MISALFGKKCGACGKRTRDPVPAPLEASFPPQAVICKPCSLRLKAEADARAEAEAEREAEAKRWAEAAAKRRAEEAKAEVEAKRQAAATAKRQTEEAEARRRADTETAAKRQAEGEALRNDMRKGMIVCQNPACQEQYDLSHVVAVSDKIIKRALHGLGAAVIGIMSGHPVLVGHSKRDTREDVLRTLVTLHTTSMSEWTCDKCKADNSWKTSYRRNEEEASPQAKSNTEAAAIPTESNAARESPTPITQALTPSADSLNRAAYSGNLAEVESLLTKRAEINAKGLKDWIALIAACDKGHFTVAQVLINKGADVDAQTNEGETALMRAAAGGYDQIIEALLAKNADVNVRSHFGETAFSLASKRGHQSVLTLLRGKGVGPVEGPTVDEVQELRNLGTGLKAIADSLEFCRLRLGDKEMAEKYANDETALKAYLFVGRSMRRGGPSADDMGVIMEARRQGRYRIQQRNDGGGGFDLIFFYPQSK